MKQTSNRIAVIGAGSWGLALSRLLANKSNQVTLWDIDKDALKYMQTHHKHPRLLPWLELPANVSIEVDQETAVRDKDYIVLTVPSHAMKISADNLKNRIDYAHPPVLVSCAKGLEQSNLKTMSEVIREMMPQLPEPNIVVLSGPSHAEEVSKDIPTTVAVSSAQPDYLKNVQELFTTSMFRVYTNMDLVGVEMGGALKNVIAIAAGACDGMGFGDNTKAALITRGLAEITRLGVKKGANPHTFSGLSGLGDLVVTCMSQHSRNRKFGELKAKGLSTDDALNEIGMVVEGLKTAEVAQKLSEKYEVEMPITNQIYSVIYQGKSVKAALMDLMSRDLKSELEYS